MKWIDRLSSDVRERLGHCRSLKRDIPELVNAKWASLQEEGKDKTMGLTKEDALVCVLEWLDCNGQDFGSELTVDEYYELCE